MITSNGCSATIMGGQGGRGFSSSGGVDKPINAAFLRADLQRGLRDGPSDVEPDKLDWNHVVTPGAWLRACISS